MTLENTLQKKRKNLIDIILDLKDPETDQPLTEIQVLDHLITFLIAGHETTSHHLSFVLHDLAMNPEVILHYSHLV